jgi:hypothetical protein
MCKNCKATDAELAALDQLDRCDFAPPANPETSSDLVKRLTTALDLLTNEDGRQDKLHDLLETIREQIRLEVAPEHRPEALFTNIQNAVYAMRGRTRLLDDAAIVEAVREAATTIERLTAERLVFDGVAKSKLESVTSRGWNVCGYAIEKDGEYGLVTTGGFVGWWSAADANARAAEERALAAESLNARQAEALKAIADRAAEMQPSSAGDYARCFGDLVRLIDAGRAALNQEDSNAG